MRLSQLLSDLRHSVEQRSAWTCPPELAGAFVHWLHSNQLNLEMHNSTYDAVWRSAPPAIGRAGNGDQEGLDEETKRRIWRKVERELPQPPAEPDRDDDSLLHWVRSLATQTAAMNARFAADDERRAATSARSAVHPARQQRARETARRAHPYKNNMFECDTNRASLCNCPLFEAGCSRVLRGEAW